MGIEDTKNVIKMSDVKSRADEKACPVRRSGVFVEVFLSGPMCGKCFPCSFGSYEARIRLGRFAEGTAGEEDLVALRRIAANMLDASMCKKGKDTARYIIENMDSGAFKEHLENLCSTKECLELIRYVISPELCTMCGKCQEVCRDNAVIGEKKKPYLSGYLPYEIVQKRCTKCGECIKVCPEGAILLLDLKETVTGETQKVGK